ncbi:MAG: triphosphoribosyl-dephospho-CoA synthase [Verrucomicrobiota bacterium]
MRRPCSVTSLCPPLVRLSPASIARCAANALTEELATYPKPGLVSFVDRGSHPDMDAECFFSLNRGDPTLFRRHGGGRSRGDAG